MKDSWIVTHAYKLHDTFMAKTKELLPGALIEPCTTWYTAVYLD